MTITLFAMPYDISATGFYFTSADEFTTRANALRNAYGQPVEEFEIQFIDGTELDAELARAIGLTQGNMAGFLDCAAQWEDWEKVEAIIAIGEYGYDFIAVPEPEFSQIDLWGVETLRELAETFVEDGIYGDIPESLRFYIDYDAIARDLSMEYSEITIAGDHYVYACR